MCRAEYIAKAILTSANAVDLGGERSNSESDSDSETIDPTPAAQNAKIQGDERYY